jgi:hypothetical protein
VNSTMNTTKVVRHPAMRTQTGRRTATLAIALACQLALPATAGDSTSNGQPTARGLNASPAQAPDQASKFAFTGMYRFATRRKEPARFGLPHLTTGSLPPAPIKPNELPTGSLGGPGPTSSAISAPAKSHLVVTTPRNPREPVQATHRSEGPATGPLKQVSRADVAPASPARISDPLPVPTAPTTEVPTSTDDKPTTVRKSRRTRTTRHRIRVHRHHEGSGLPTSLPEWWRDAWSRDGPT